MDFDEIIEKINEDSDKIIDSYILDIVEKSEEDPTKLSSIDQAVLLSIFLLWNQAVDDIAAAVIDDINNQTGDTLEGSISDEQINHHKEIGVFFFSEAFRRISYRVHSSNIAIQLDNEDSEEERKSRDEEIENAIDSGKNGVHNSAFTELALAYGLFAKSEQIARGIDNYIWRTKNDSRVRPTHRANEGIEFSWETPPATGHAGVAHNCRCVAIPAIGSPRSKIERVEMNKSKQVKNKGKLPFSVVNMSDDRIEINVSGEIGSDWYDEGENNTMERVGRILHDNLKEISVYINSNGGDLSHGVAVYNLLSKHPATVKTYVIGHAHSAASIIFMAGDERYMPYGTTSIAHNPWDCMCGDYQDAEKYAKQMKQFAESIVDVYASKMAISKDEVRGMLDREDVVIANEALELGYTTGNIDFASDKMIGNIKNIVDSPDQISEARSFIAEMRKCAINNTKGKKMPKERIDTTAAEAEAKLSIAEKTNADLKIKNSALKESEKKLQDKIEALELEKSDALETEKLNEVRSLLEKHGISADGSTSEELKQDVLNKFDVKNAKEFTGSVLDSMFDYVLSQTELSEGDADSVYSKAVFTGGEDGAEKANPFASTNKIMERSNGS